MKYFLPLVLVLTSFAAQAQLDKSSRDLLIQKLNRVQMTLAPNDPSKVSVTLRLADLLADRARLDAQADLESGCTVCQAGQADREKALKLYKEVAEKTTETNRGKVYIQIGHLLQLTGQESEAGEYYQKVIATNQAAEFITEAKLSLAELAFKKHQYAVAKNYYQEVLTGTGKASKGLAAYRVSWCQYNLGEVEPAIAGLKVMLNTPALLSRTVALENQVDEQFAEEVSRDLVTFVAQKGPTKTDIEDIFKLSPAAIKVSNVQMLAAESERLGKKQEALKVWNFAKENQAKPEDRLESLIHIAALELDTNNRQASIASFDAALTLWGELKGCGKSNCQEQQKYMRNYIVNWNKVEKKSPSVELLSSYQKYAQTFSDDFEMIVWGVQVAKELGDFKTAEALTQAAIQLSLQNKNSENLERTLLSQIEIAEAAKDETFLSRAQEQYLKLSQKKDKAFEVRYQIAQQMYEKSNYERALPLLRELALEKQGTPAIRKQAADLALDGLVLVKDDLRLAEWSAEFAKEFVANRAEFLNIKQKAILTQAAKEAATEPAKAWATMEAFQVGEAADSDKVQFYKNKILLAEKLGKYTLAAAAADDLMNLKSASVEDQQFAVARRAWYAELQLDFSTALKFSEKIGKAQDWSDGQLLKLAIYADLSGISSKDYYVKYLNVTQDLEAKQIVAAELIRKSKNQVKEFELQKAILEKNPELMAHLLAEVFINSKDIGFLKKQVGHEKLKNTTWGKVLSRYLWNQEYQDLKAKIETQNLDGKNQKTVASTIKSRAQSLEKMETLANKAIQAGDWTAQILVLSVLSKEADRFYTELMSLPIPEGLTAEEEQQYMSLLGQQAGPYKNKADLAKAKVSEFWNLANWHEELKRTLRESGELASLIELDVKLLAQVARAEDQTYFTELQASPVRVTTNIIKETEQARNAIREKPFDRMAIEKLLEMEKENKNFAMVQYLEGRLKSLANTEAK